MFLFSLAGCATARKRNELEIQGLKNQISVLEAQVQSKDEEINGLRESLTKAQSEAKPETTQEEGKKRIKVIGEEKFHPSAKHVQMALKNAGYNPGRVDGKLGKQSREALKAFQKANNLKENGKAGKETWDLLKEYLYKKSK
jgi:peptidoglycan hydrolase-like protein with peptidoglycan-binding domain